VGTRSYKAVFNAFRGEAEEAYRFLVTEFDFDGPEHDNFVLPSLRYVRRGVRWTVLFDTHEVGVMTELEAKSDGKRLVADLGDLVRAAGLGSPQGMFSHSAQSVHNLRKSLLGQANVVRRLVPFTSPEDAPAFLRKAGAREWRA
jgi:hypothetical protein